jgi:hypothetical protein
MFSRKEKKPDSTSRSGSLAFYLSIPANYLLAIFLLGCTFFYVRKFGDSRGAAFLFSHAFLAGAIISSQFEALRFRTFIHELKHAVMVIFTGNRLKGFRAGAGEGEVTYALYEDSLHLKPFIKLAPYYFPLFSLPAFIAAVFFEDPARSSFVYALGFLFGVDLSMGYREIHCIQSDLKRVYGGFLATRSFIFGSYLCWFSLIFFWAIGGRAGYVIIFNTLMKLIGL